MRMGNDIVTVDHQAAAGHSVTYKTKREERQTRKPAALVVLGRNYWAQGLTPS